MNHLEGLNARQKEAASHKDGPLLIIAGAGAGKTKTLTHRILNLIREGVRPENILAITFTNKAASEMRERTEALLGEQGEGKPLICTFHSLGVKILKENHALLGLPKYFTILDEGDAARLVKEAIVLNELDPKQYEPRRFKNIISRQKGNFVTREEFERDASDYLEKIVVRIWRKYEELQKKEKALDFDDLLLSTVLLLSKNENLRKIYRERFKYLHVDEYQDTNQVQYELCRLLAGEHKNICVVGDSDQCLVGDTKITMADGSKKSIEKIKQGEMILSNYGCGDFRPARVLRAMKRIKNGELVRITTEQGKVLTSTPEHIHFAGYKLGITPQLYFTYLMYKKNIGWRLGTTQVHTKGQKEPIIGIVLRSNQEHSDSIWVIATHNTPNEARILEYTLSLKYQIPTLPFVARKGLSFGGYVHDQEALNKIFGSFDTNKSARELLNYYGLSEDYPHHHARSLNSNRRNINVTLCADRRAKTPMHLISVAGNDEKGRLALKSLGLSVRQAKQGSSSWRFETVRKDYGELIDITEKIRHVLPDTHIVAGARLGGNKKNQKDGNSLPYIPAGSIMPGMALFSDHGGYDVVKKIERVNTKKINVYDINIEKTHNFIANGILTHNCIYNWRGANLKNILNFEEDYPGAKTVLLEQNYRSSGNILEAANSVIKKNKERKDKNLFTEAGAGDRISLYEATDEADEADFVATKILEFRDQSARLENIAVLYRANFQSRALEEALLTYNIPYQVLGTKFFERKEVKDVLSYLRAALNPDGLSDIKRIINMPARGLGKLTIVKLFSGQKESLPEKTRLKIEGFYALLESIRDAASNYRVSDTIKFIIRETGLESSLKEGTDEDLERLENIKELVTLTKKYDNFPSEEGVQKLLEETALMSDQDNLEEEKKGVKLMTVHASKGLEFETVFIVGLEQDLFPHRRDDAATAEEMEEERRLFYVALTRAKKKIYLSNAQSRMIFGSRGLASPSEFLFDIPENLVEREQKQYLNLKSIYY